MPETTETEDNVKLAGVRIKPSAAQIVKEVGTREKRSMVGQAAYIIEQWADNEANRTKQTA